MITAVKAAMDNCGRRAQSAVILAVALAFLAGCLETGYVIQAGLGQLRLRSQARPIDQVLADSEVDRRTKILLQEVPHVLAFADKNGLRSKGNYQTYVDLDRPSVVWFMAASKPLAFEPKLWSFPIVGSFTYVGWFDYREAQQIKRILVSRGLDVHVRRVRAFSTGGWFRDPILSTMLSDEDDAFRSLANVLIHELTHANILVNDQSTFNESVASFVGDTMAEQYLIKRFGPDSAEVVAYREEQAEDRKRGQRMARAYQELAALYDSDATDAAKLAGKRRIIDQLEAELALPYRANNASLLGFKTYNAGLAEFARLYEVCNRDWPRFLAAVGQLDGSAFAEEQLEIIGPVIDKLTARGCRPSDPQRD